MTTDDGDRYAAMVWPHGDRPCPSCGFRPDGIPVYRPRQPAPIPPEGRAAYAATSREHPA